MKQTLLLLSFLILSACVSLPENTYPDFLNLEPEYNIVWGYIDKGEYLPEVDISCAKDHICISLDPPPQKLVINVEEVIFGEIQSKTITAYTTSHYGLSTYSDQVPYLFVLKSNGKELIIPRYSPREIAFDLNENPTLPMLSKHDIPEWFPCKMYQLVKEIKYDGSQENVLHAIEEFTPEELMEIQGFSEISTYSVRAVKGIYLSDIKNFLARHKCEK